MVFSFFKKKDKQPEEKMPERPVARPKPLVMPASSLPPVAELPANALDKSKPVDLPDLDFSPSAKPAISRPAVPVAVDHGKPAQAAGGKAPAMDPEFTVSEFERNFTESSVMAIDVDHGLDPVQADIEQVAVLFANGQDPAARSLLDIFVRTYEGEDVRRFWAMYFDFLQLTGDRATFDQMGLVFAENCETSPPAWQPQRVIRTMTAPEVSVFELQGVLTAEGAKILTPVLAAVERKSPIKLSCNKLLGCDDEIAGQIAAILQRARVLSVPVDLEGSDRLLSSLRTRMVAGQKKDAASWRLCFELLQRAGAQAEFEERAVDFAVTFEQSPPSWVELPSLAEVAETPALPKDAYYLSGDIRSCKFEDLKPVFEKHRLPILDFSGVRRIDFFSAGQLANRLGIFKHGGREIIIRSPNHLVAELMGVVGINKYARILVPKS